jgi:signal transduction histidine kinase
MQSALPAQQHIERQRARFETLRRRIFTEMEGVSARWKLAWILPFHLLVFLVLVARGECTWRATIQGTSVGLIGLLLTMQAIRPGLIKPPIGVFIGMLSYFGAVAATGGLASPIIVVGVLPAFGASMALSEPRWAKPVFFAIFFLGYIALALLSRTPIGQLAAPLAPDHGYSTAEYVSITTLSLAYVFAAIFKMGCHISRAYEHAAIELAERREELCTETEDRTRALEGIAARLAHEVKNPLAAIKGLSTHMARNATDPKVAERLSIVAGEADRLQSIVDGFLSFSRGFDDLKVAPTKPQEIAREIVLLLETRAAETGVTLDVKGGEDITVNADARKIRQALLNLVLNAMQATPSGKAVRVEIKSGCENVYVKVADEGSGMTPDVLERIKKPYFTTKQGGSGLGVAVARGLVEQHGGQLKFESSPGRGTTVTIELPRCAKDKCQAALPKVKPIDVSAETPARYLTRA